MWVKPAICARLKAYLCRPNQIPRYPMVRSFATVLFLLCFAANLFAQSAAEPPADFLRSMGKIYVVVAVIAVVFLGLAIYLWSLDRRLSNLENQIDDHA